MIWVANWEPLHCVPNGLGTSALCSQWVENLCIVLPMGWEPLHCVPNGLRTSALCSQWVGNFCIVFPMGWEHRNPVILICFTNLHDIIIFIPVPMNYGETLFKNLLCTVPCSLHSMQFCTNQISVCWLFASLKVMIDFEAMQNWIIINHKQVSRLTRQEKYQLSNFVFF